MGDRPNAWSRYAWAGYQIGGAANPQLSFDQQVQVLTCAICPQQPTYYAQPTPINYMQPAWSGIAQPTYPQQPTYYAQPTPINYMQPAWSGIAQPTFYAPSAPNLPGYPMMTAPNPMTGGRNAAAAACAAAIQSIEKLKEESRNQFTVRTGAGQQNQSGPGTPWQLALPSPGQLALPSTAFLADSEQSASKQSARITAKFEDITDMDIGTDYFSDNKVTCQGVRWRLWATIEVHKGEVCLAVYLDSRLHKFAPGECYSVDYEITLLNQKKGRRDNRRQKSTNELFPDPETGYKAWGTVFTSIPFRKLISPKNGFVVNDSIIVQCDFSVSRC